ALPGRLPPRGPGGSPRAGRGRGAQHALRPAEAGVRPRRGLLPLRPRGRGRGARIGGAVAGYGSLFSGGRHGVDSVKAAMALALDRAGVAPGSVDLVSASASSSREPDFVEAEAIGGLLGREVPVTAVKSMLGECMGASGALQAAAALVALESGTIPPTINTTESDPELRP